MLYPVENQMADKVCAMYGTYAGGPSTRYRDLYDLAVLADRSQPDLAVLIDALSTQESRRGVSLPSRMGPPTNEWPAQYDRAARRMAGAKDPYREFLTAIAKSAAVIDPALAQVHQKDGGQVQGVPEPLPRGRTTPSSAE